MFAHVGRSSQMAGSVAVRPWRPFPSQGARSDGPCMAVHDRRHLSDRGSRQSCVVPGRHCRGLFGGTWLARHILGGSGAIRSSSAVVPVESSLGWSCGSGAGRNEGEGDVDCIGVASSWLCAREEGRSSASLSSGRPGGEGASVARTGSTTRAAVSFSHRLPGRRSEILWAGRPGGLTTSHGAEHRGRGRTSNRCRRGSRSRRGMAPLRN